MRIRRIAAGAWHRVAVAWFLFCARDDAWRLGLTVPSGVWLCGRCDQVMWDPREFDRHARAHPG